MAITVTTSDPGSLLKAIKRAIDDRTVETWIYDQDGDFTHSPEQLARKAWLRPSVAAGSLKLRLLGQQDVQMTKTIFGVYHGRFIEMLLTHFDTIFSAASATAGKDPGDFFS